MAALSEQYNAQLIDLWQQEDHLRAYNARYWGEHFTEADFQQLDLRFRGAQSLDRVATIHAEFETPLETLRQWRAVYFQDMSGLAHWNSLYLESHREAETFRLHESARRYEPGLHVVEVDMTYGRTEQGSVEALRRAAIAAGDIPAQSEVISLIGLQQALRVNHGNLSSYIIAAEPYAPGYEFRNPYGRSDHTDANWDWVPRYDYGQGNVGLRIFPASTPHIGVIPLVKP